MNLNDIWWIQANSGRIFERGEYRSVDDCPDVLFNDSLKSKQIRKSYIHRKFHCLGFWQYSTIACLKSFLWTMNLKRGQIEQFKWKVFAPRRFNLFFRIVDVTLQTCNFHTILNHATETKQIWKMRHLKLGLSRPVAVSHSVTEVNWRKLFQAFLHEHLGFFPFFIRSVNNARKNSTTC